MKDIRRFGTNELFGIKAIDNSVRTRTKVAVLGAFNPQGSVRPGFKVNMMSTEGVGGTAQVIRFDDRHEAERWIDIFGSTYGYDQDEIGVMRNIAQEFIRLPLCDFGTDVWVNSVIVGRFKSRTIQNLQTYCPEYFDDETPNNTPIRYRGFRF